MILATVSSHSCFCWLYIASSSLAAKNIINLISILPTWQCWCVESSLVLLEEGVCYDLWLWRLYGGVNGDLLHEGLCHTQVYCTQSCCPCSRPLLNQTSTGYTQTQFCLSLCGVSGSWCTQGLFEPSEHLWQVWGLILNVILSLLPSCWGFSICPWTWSISSKSLQHHTATTPVLHSHWRVVAVC